jgi:hypothetical protein
LPRKEGGGGRERGEGGREGEGGGRERGEGGREGGRKKEGQEWESMP